MAREVEQAAGTEPINEVRLRGRLSGDPEQRELPSGDAVVGFRLVVERPTTGRQAGRAALDTIDCAAFRAAPRRAVQRCDPGDIIEVHGALHRRFYATVAGRASRYEVEAIAVRRAARAGRSGDRGRDTMSG
jgi:single-strand DNA-binding protein